MSVAVDIPPKPGEIVRVRSRRYLVEGVDPAPKPEDQTLVHLSCLEDDAEGEELSVLWEKELDAERMSGENWSKLTSGQFDDPRDFAAYYHTLRWNTVTATDPTLFQAPYRAGIKIDAYQLEPLRKALLLPRVNLFIADDVGLGKTIEAGLIVRELLMRQRVRRIVVAAPPSVVLQWKDELDQRFGLTFVVFDRDYVRRMRQERGFGVNPWTTHSRFIVSHHLLRDEDYASPLRDWLRDFRILHRKLLRLHLHPMPRRPHARVELNLLTLQAITRRPEPRGLRLTLGAKGEAAILAVSVLASGGMVNAAVRVSKESRCRNLAHRERHLVKSHATRLFRSSRPEPQLL